MNFIEEELAKTAIKAFLVDYRSKNNDDYEFNDDKCDKMNDIICYCQKLETEYDCKIIRCMLEPRYEQGYIQVLFNGELPLGEKKASLEEFINTLKLCDGVNITANTVGEDLFQITFFVEKLWIHKRKQGK